MNEGFYLAIERRIEYLIVGLGTSAALGVLLGWGMRSCEGVAAGTALCWLNFRWLRHRAVALMQLGLAQAGVEAVRIPKRVYAGSFGRLGLMLIMLYVILIWLRMPLIAVMCGLFLVIPAVIVEALYEVLSGLHSSDAS